MYSTQHHNYSYVGHIIRLPCITSDQIIRYYNYIVLQTDIKSQKANNSYPYLASYQQYNNIMCFT